MELWNIIEKKQEMLDKAIKELANNGYDLAVKEREYKIAVNKKALILRDERSTCNTYSTGYIRV